MSGPFWFADGAPEFRTIAALTARAQLTRAEIAAARRTDAGIRALEAECATLDASDWQTSVRRNNPLLKGAQRAFQFILHLGEVLGHRVLGACAQIVEIADRIRNGPGGAEHVRAREDVQ